MEPSTFSEEKKKQSVGEVATLLIGSLLGIAIGKYSWAQLWLPSLSAWLIFFLGKKFIPLNKKHWLLPLSIQMGHFSWLFVGFLFIGENQALEILPDIIIMFGAIVWLYLKPGFWPFAVLMGYQVISTLLNAYVFLNVEFGTLPHKAILIHIIFRLAAIVTSFMAYKEHKKQGQMESDEPITSNL